MKKVKNAVVVHSQHAGRATLLSPTLTLLQQAGVNIDQVISIADLDDLPAQGQVWQERGIDIAIAAGGDGLVGGVITHIAESGLPLGILPLGTANDIARSLNIPLNLAQAVEIIVTGKETEVDIGVAKPAEQAPHHASSEQGGPVVSQVPFQKQGYFAHVLTVGLNVQFARLATNVAARQRYGRFTYPIAALEVLAKHEALQVDLHFDRLVLPQQHLLPYYPSPALSASAMEQVSLQCRALQVTVINAPIFGGQWQLAVPGATMHDQLLDIVVIEDIDVRSLSSIIADFFNLQGQHPASQTDQKAQNTVHLPGELTGLPGIHHLQAHGVTIVTNADPRDVTLDGEVRGQTPTLVCVASERLKVMVP